MHLETTLIISSGNCSFKTNQRSQFSNFSHPLKVLQKTDNQMLEMLMKHDETKTNSYGFTTTKFDSTKGSFREKEKNKQKNSKTKAPEYFNEDQGILEHIYKHTQFSKNFNPKQTNSFHPRSTKQCQWSSVKSSQNEPKCLILFGFSINLLEIHNFHAQHPELNLNIKLYQYGDNEYFKEMEIKSLEEEPFEENPMKYNKIVEALNGEELLDCEQVSFVLSYWASGQLASQSEQGETSDKQRKTFIYFFPNINALKSEEQRKQERTQLTLGLPGSTTSPKQAHTRRNTDTSNQYQTPVQTMTSLRKSHQNFRILQVLEYYLKLQCHSDHIMITSNESRIIKDFLELIYESSVKEFFVYIDHERKNQNRTAKNTVRSILANKYAKDRCILRQDEKEDSFLIDEEQNMGNGSPTASNVCTSDICSEKQFISIDGELIINDEFLSKLSELKLPEPWLDSVEFREQKKLMYKMKLQEYTESKELKKMRDEFTDTINYLKSLIGLEKVTYDQISIESLKVIKNAKIRQATQEVKELENVWQEKQIRNEQLKQKIKEYENQKNSKNQDHEQNLSQLRKDILTVQKQLNLHRNQLNAIYYMEEDKANKQNTQNRQSTFPDEPKAQHANSLNSKENDASLKVLEKSVLGKLQPRSHLKGEKGAHPQPKESLLSPEKAKHLIQNILTSASSNDEKLLQPFLNQKMGRQSLVRGIHHNSKLPLRAESFLNRGSSQLLSKYAPILEQLRKQKYEQSLKQEMTKCEFEAEKEYEKYKQEYTKACRELRMVLNDCD